MSSPSHGGGPPPGPVSDDNKKMDTRSMSRRPLTDLHDQPSASKAAPFGIRVSNAIHHALGSVMGRIGVVVGTWPWTTIVVMTIVAMVLGSGVVFRFKFEADSEDLWTSLSSDSHQQRPFVAEHFNDFNPRFHMWAAARDRSTNLLTTDLVLDVFDAWALITSNVSGTCKSGSSCAGDPVVFEDACRRLYTGAPCNVVSVLDYFPSDRAALAAMSDADIVSAVNSDSATDASGRPLQQEDVLGGVSRNASGHVVSAVAFQFLTMMSNELEEVSELEPRTDPKSLAWEEAMVAFVRAFPSDSVVQYLPLSTTIEALDQEKSRTRDSVAVLPIGYVLLMTYSALVFLNKRSAVQSSTVMALAALYSVILALISAFGFALFLGLTFNSIIPIMILIVLGLGVDDAFVLMEGLDHVEHDHQKQLEDTGTAASSTPSQRSIPAHLKLVMASGGTSILATSVTDVVAFATGGSTRIHALSVFCLYASFAILFDFVFQVTVFAAAMAIDMRRRDTGRLDCLCCVRRKRKAADVVSSAPTKSFLTRFVGETLPPVLLSPTGKTVVAILTLTVFSVGLYGAVNLGDEFKLEILTPDDSPLQDAYSVRDTYFNGRSLFFGVYTQSADYHASQGALTALTEAVRSCEWVGAVTSWHEHWQTWVSASGGDPAALGASDFYSSVHSFLSSSSGRVFEENVVFVNDSDPSAGILASLLGAESPGQMTTRKGILHLDSVRSCVSGVDEAKHMKPFPWTFLYLYVEGNALIKVETIRNVIWACCAVMVVALLLLGSLGAAFVVFVNVVLTGIELLGFLHWIDTSFNIITCVVVTLSVGIALDGIAHLSKAFVETEGTGNERATKALQRIGRSVVNGGMSTLLAVLPLGIGSENYVFQTFGRCFTAIVVLGMFHGLIVGPVMLSMVFRKSNARPPARSTTPTGIKDDGDVVGGGGGGGGVDDQPLAVV